MLCPACTAPLQVVTRHEVAIDRCPSCGGVWLDRGELERLIERGAEAETEARRRARDRDDDDDDFDFDDDSEHRDRRVPTAAGRVPQKKRKGFLSEIFDFG